MTNAYVSSLNIKDVVAGPVPEEPFVPGSANLFPKMTSRINDMAWELWEFEGFSTNGEATVGISLYRDARGQEKGGFQAELNAIWPDGQKWSETLYFAESIIEEKGDSPDDMSVHGVWKSVDEDHTARTIDFMIKENQTSATVRFSVPNRVTGIIELRSFGAHPKSQLPATDEAALLCPSVYYIFPMGPVTANANLTFAMLAEDEERDFCLHPEDGGYGGMVRGWSSKAWPQFMNDAYYVVAKTGPYMLQLLHIAGPAAADHRPHVVARLYRDNELMCAANRVFGGEATCAATTQGCRDAVLVKKVPGGPAGQGGLTGAFRDKNVGCAIEFVSAQHKRWRFELRHKRALWGEPTSAPGPECTGKSGWIEAAFGGSDGEMFEGAGVGGQLQIPIL